MSPVEDLHVGDEPFDRLTQFCDVMTNALRQAISEERRDLILSGIEDPEEIEKQSPEVRGIVFLGTTEQGGIQSFGYEDTTSALADLLIHMQAMFESEGKRFGLMTDKGLVMLSDDTWTEAP